MKKEDSKAKVYGQNEKIWYLCIPYYFLRNPTMSLLETKMGDKGLLIYMRLLFLATESQGILRLDNAEEETFFGRYINDDNDTPSSPISSIVSALGNKYSEQEVYKTLKILERCGAIKVLAEEQVRFRDVYEMGVEKQRRAAEKRAKRGRIRFENEGLEEPEETEEEPEEPDEQPEELEETEEERKKREKKEAAKKKRAEEKARIDEFIEKLFNAYIPGHGRGRTDVKAARRKELFEIGEEKCMQALEAYKRCKRVEDGFIQNFGNFLNDGIDDFLNMPETQQTVQPPKPVTEEDVIKKLIEAEVETPSGFDWDRWERFKPCCSPKEVEIAEARGRKLTGKTA